MVEHLNQNSTQFASLIEFVKFTHLFQKVDRVVLVNGEHSWENDSEHSFQLALTAWYIVEHGNLDLDLGKVTRMALVHDLVEAYAGDTFIYDKPEVLATKEKREKEALERIKVNFPDFPSLHHLIEEYEARETRESRFVYALDKLVPILNIYTDEGRTWHQEGITLDQLLEAKTDKIALSPEIVPYYDEMVDILRQSKHLFTVESS